MARKDAIEVEGKVVELAAQHDVSGRVGQWASRPGAYFRENALALHSHLARRQSYARDFTLRFVEGANYFSPKVTTRTMSPRFPFRGL